MSVSRESRRGSNNFNHVSRFDTRRLPDAELVVAEEEVSRTLRPALAALTEVALRAADLRPMLCRMSSLRI